MPEIDLIKAQLERDKLAADIDVLRAQSRQHDADARKSDAEAIFAEVRSLAEQRGDVLLQASDANHLIYRFQGAVDEESAPAAIYRLGQWSRLHPGEDIEIVFTSPGGSLVAGFALYDRILQLRADGHKVTTGTLGQAASMAGILLQAGDVRWMGSQAWFLIHRAGFGALGKTFEVEDSLNLIKRFEARIVDIFVSRSNLTATKIKKSWERQDWWLDAEQCLEFGLIDEIRGAEVTRAV